MSPEFISPYTRTLGDVLRSHRKAIGWTRKDLQKRLDADISLQTLATYELGTRHMHVARLDGLARALDTRAHLILTEVDYRVYQVADAQADGKFAVNLAKLAATTRDDLVPAARWAAVHAAELDIVEPVAFLPLGAIDMLATLCHLDLADMFRELRRFAA